MTLRRSLGVVLVAVLPFTVACAAGRNTTTDKEHSTPWIPTARSGSIVVTAAALIPASSSGSSSASAMPSTTPSPTGTPSPGSSKVSVSTGTPTPPTQAYLVAVVSNSGDRSDQLSSISVQGATIDLPAGGVTVKPRESFRFGNPDVGDNADQTLPVSGFGTTPVVGRTVTVTFVFRDAGSLTLRVPVRASESYGTTTTGSPVPLTSSRPPIERAPEETPSP